MAIEIRSNLGMKKKEQRDARLVQALIYICAWDKNIPFIIVVLDIRAVKLFTVYLVFRVI